jgi:hypothetical protein
MGDLNDALNELAGRGTPRGFDDVFAAAERDAALGSVPGVDGSAGRGDDLDPIPLAEVEPVARPRRPMHSVIAAAGVAALVLVGGLAVNAAVGSGGGAGSPEAAVRKLADAISQKDPLAAADVIAPDEVRSLHDTLSHAEAKAAELQLIRTAGAPLAGVDLNVSGLDLSSQSLGAGVAKVTIDAGTISASTHRTQFSPLMQKVLQGPSDNSAQSDLAALARKRNLPTFVVTVRRNGNWYVSAAYTVLEYLREANNLPGADFGSGERALASLGADSPDAAVQDAMRALQQRDWSKLMTLVAPDEIPVYDYRAALVALAQRSDSGDSSGGWFTLDSMTTSSEVDGDQAKVTLRAAGQSESSTWSIDGGCFTQKAKPGSDNYADPFPYCDEMPDRYAPGVFPIGLFPFLTLKRDSQISLVREDGRWFVSPVGTALDVVNGWIDRLDKTMLDELLGLPPTGPIDGNLVLGRPVSFETGGGKPRFLSFDGHRGETLIGRDSSSDVPSTMNPAMLSGVLLRVVGPDGNEQYAAGGLLQGNAFVLPADGRYTFIFQPLGQAKSWATIWDYANAPPDVQAQSPGGQPTCTFGRNSESCSSSSSSGGDSGIGAAPVCTPEMKAKPELQQLCAQLGGSSSTFPVGPAPTMSISSGSGSSDSGSVSASSIPHG